MSSNQIITRYELEESKREIKSFLIEYIRMCAETRIKLIQDGEIDEILTAVKGEISMAAMECRIDLARELSEKLEELACIDVDLRRLDAKSAEDNWKR